MVGATISTILNMAKVFLLYSDFFLLSMMTVKIQKSTSQKNAIGDQFKSPTTLGHDLFSIVTITCNENFNSSVV